MADSAAAVLPVGAGYGNLSHVSACTTLIGVLRRRRRHWVFLCLPHDGDFVDSESVHSVLDETIRGVQHSVSICQARSHSFGDCLGMDLGSYVIAVKYSE